MQLFRLDAVHDAGDGEFVKFYQAHDAAFLAEARFALCGWCCDVYAVDLDYPAGATVAIASRLLAGVWPNEATDALVQMAIKRAEVAQLDPEQRVDAIDTVGQAAADLDQILARRRRRRRNAK
jgi:hypothetical protein